MPRFDPVQSNFTGGEFSPRLLGNFELEKYTQGVKTLENLLVQPYGGVSRRGGFRYVTAVKDSSKTIILQEFKYKDEFSYILEFGHNYMRFYRNQEQIVNSYSAWTTTTAYVIGDLVTEAGEWYRCLIVHTSGTFTTDLAAGKWVVSGGATDLAYEIVTTYGQTEVTDLRFTQDEDALYIVHKNHLPARLTRISHTSWTLEDIEFEFGTGANWKAYNSAEGNTWVDVCWSPKLNLFCAIANDGTDRVMISFEGISWFGKTAASVSSWAAVCWSPELELFCAVGNGVVMTSPTGETWTTRTPSQANDWRGVCWSPSLTLFVAVAHNGTNRVMTSPDGINWTNRSAAAAKYWLDVCWNPDDSLFVAVAEDITSTDSVMTSTNGVDWVSRTAAAQDGWKSVCWANTLSLFVAVAVVGSGSRIMTSPDGITWTARSGIGIWRWESICWASELELLVAVDANQGRIMTSLDGITWTERTSPSNTDIKWLGVCWSPDLYAFCIVSRIISGTSVTDRVAISTSSIYRKWVAGNYPTLCWFFEQRFFLAATPNEPNEVWGSKSTDYFNFDVGTGLDNEAINIKIKDAIKLLWVTTSIVIILGAHNAEFKLAANNLNEALTPTNIRPVKCTSYGSAFLSAIDVDGNVIFIQRGLRKLRRLEYEFTKDRYKAVDISILGEHITESGLVDVAYINEPESLIWGVREDGKLICLTYEPEYQIYGWSKHIVGGVDVKVKNIAISDAIEANEDELWAIISRTINSETVQYIEFLTQGLTPEDAQVDAFFVDSGITKTGEDIVTVDGLTHLIGETVSVFADGLIQTPKVVNGDGEITITAADKVQVGLPYASILETLPMEGGNPVGSAMGKIKRISKIVLRLYKSLKFTISNLLGDTGETVILDTSLYTDDSNELDFPGGYETGGQIKIVIDDPVPFTLLALMYKARTGE